ncbi:MAG: hypothetical protein GY913_03060 [Proteobacteria bacterium]|nr:hypothetical protein [Pseudomonadota bacterium]MCP4915879.1 hypothetical protein [Pseudomonadota bacterium]
MFLLLACVGPRYQDPTPLAVSYSNHVEDDVVVMLVLGDSGKAGPDQVVVAEHAAETCARAGCDFTLLLGDNVYEIGARRAGSKRFVESWEEPFAAVSHLPTWVVMGNHDWQLSAQAQIDFTNRSASWKMPDLHYAVPALPEWLTVYGWDTDLLYRWPESEGTVEMLAAMEAELCAGEGQKIAFAHRPLVSSGVHGLHPRELVGIRAAIDPMFAKCGVDLALGGHDHQLEHIDGATYDMVLSGSASKTRPLCDEEGASEVLCGQQGTPGQHFISSDLGYAIVTARPDRIDVVMYSVEQTEPVYSFTR